MPIGLGKALLLGGSSVAPALAVGDNGATHSTYGLTVYLGNGEIDDRYGRLFDINVRHLKWHSDGVRLIVTPSSGGPFVVGPGVVGSAPPDITSSWWTDESWSGQIFMGVGNVVRRYELDGYELVDLLDPFEPSITTSGTIGAMMRPYDQYRDDHGVAIGSVDTATTTYRSGGWPSKRVVASSTPFSTRPIRWLDTIGPALGNDVDPVSFSSGDYLAAVASGLHPNITVNRAIHSLTQGVEDGYPTGFPQPITGTGEAEVHACAWSPDRRWLAFAGVGGYLIVDTETKWWDFAWDYGNWNKTYHSCTWSSDSHFVAFGSSSSLGSVEWMNVQEKQTFIPFVTSGRAARIAFNPKFTADQLVTP